MDKENTHVKEYISLAEGGKMKHFIILLAIFAISHSLFADSSITRGPDIGEIYYIGPTATQPSAIYHTIDFGETTTCVDSTLDTNINFGSITADLTPGVLYGYSSPENLYISIDYGQEGSWVHRGSNYLGGPSGRNEGHLYKGFAQHSEDYGMSFINHQCQGLFGTLKSTEIDNEDNVGYILVRQSGILDSLWLLITYDNYENLEVQHVFNDYIGTNYLTRGNANGELYLYRHHSQHGKNILYSNDYGESWEIKSTFNCPNLPIKGIVGGRQPGELYMLVEYVQLMHSIIRTDIYHSTDFGETFTVYNAFSYGPEPYYANFIATPIEGTSPLTVQFTDISSGENNQEWQWDFDGDGEIDSTEQNPEYTYEELGTFTVSLTIFWTGQAEMTATQEIAVTDSVSINNEDLQITNCELSNHPNPFNPVTTISFDLTTELTENTEINIYNIKGQKVEQISVVRGKTSVSWNADEFSSGIYFYKLNTADSPVKKMVLLK